MPHEVGPQGAKLKGALDSVSLVCRETNCRPLLLQKTLLLLKVHKLIISFTHTSGDVIIYTDQKIPKGFFLFPLNGVKNLKEFHRDDRSES